MSAKNAKAARRILRAYRFPKLLGQHTPKQFGPVKPGYTPPTYEVEADHGRRIRQLSKSERLTIKDAVNRYIKRTGMAPKPKAQ